MIEVVYQAQLNTGEKVAITHDGHHYRAITMHGVAVGVPFISLNNLLSDIKAEICGQAVEEKPEPPAPVPAPKKKRK